MPTAPQPVVKPTSTLPTPCGDPAQPEPVPTLLVMPQGPPAHRCNCPALSRKSVPCHLPPSDPTIPLPIPGRRSPELQGQGRAEGWAKHNPPRAEHSTDSHPQHPEQPVQCPLQRGTPLMRPRDTPISRQGNKSLGIALALCLSRTTTALDI